MKYPNLELLEYITENTACELFKDVLIMSTYHKFKMYVFPQTWSTIALGFDKIGGYNEKKSTEQKLRDIKRMNLYRFVASYLFKHDAFDVREVGENK